MPSRSSLSPSLLSGGNIQRTMVAGQPSFTASSSRTPSLVSSLLSLRQSEPDSDLAPALGQPSLIAPSPSLSAASSQSAPVSGAVLASRAAILPRSMLT